MFYRKCCCFNNCNNCSYDTKYNKCDLEEKCNDVANYSNKTDKCACGFDEDYNGFPEYPMYAQSYVPFQVMNEVFKPEVGLKNGTIFPELVSPYCPGQSMEEIEYIKATNSIGKGCNR